jgi:hypothetical protein
MLRRWGAFIDAARSSHAGTPRSFVAKPLALWIGRAQ